MNHCFHILINHLYSYSKMLLISSTKLHTGEMKIEGRVGGLKWVLTQQSKMKGCWGKRERCKALTGHQISELSLIELKDGCKQNTVFSGLRKMSNYEQCSYDNRQFVQFLIFMWTHTQIQLEISLCTHQHATNTQIGTCTYTSRTCICTNTRTRGTHITHELIIVHIPCSHI